MKVSCFSMLLFGIIFFQLNGMYLINGTQFPIQFQDVAILLEFVFFILAYRNREEVTKKRKNMLFLFPIVLSFTSATMGYLRYGQPFFMGLRPQRAWLVSMLMYFPLSKIIRQGRYSIDKMLNVIDRVNFIYFLLLFAQYVIGNKYIFLHIAANQRYGTIRLYAVTSFMLISYAWHLWNVLAQGQLKFVDCFYVASTLFTYFFITKSRMGMVALLGATAIVVLKQRFSKRKLFVLSIAIVAFCLFLNTDAGTEIVQLAFGENVTSAGNDTSMIRDVGRTFFITELASSIKTLLFGCGYINIDWEPTVRAVRYNDNIFVADNGMFGLVYMYGLLFLFWTVILYGKYIKDAFKNKNDFGLCIFIVGILGCFSLYPECYQNCIAFSLLCVIIEMCAMEVNQRKFKPEYKGYNFTR